MKVTIPRAADRHSRKAGARRVNRLAGYAGRCLEIVFRPQHHYKRAGVMLMQLCKREAAQPELFETRDLDASNRLMVLMDQINRDHGRGTIRLASASSMALNAGRTWHLKSDHRSPQWTTRWDEVPTAIAKRNSAVT